MNNAVSGIAFMLVGYLGMIAPPSCALYQIHSLSSVQKQTNTHQYKGDVGFHTSTFLRPVSRHKNIVHIRKASRLITVF